MPPSFQLRCVALAAKSGEQAGSGLSTVKMPLTAEAATADAGNGLNAPLFRQTKHGAIGARNFQLAIAIIQPTSPPVHAYLGAPQLRRNALGVIIQPLQEVGYLAWPRSI